jgi:hypothetical protein
MNNENSDFQESVAAVHGRPLRRFSVTLSFWLAALVGCAGESSVLKAPTEDRQSRFASEETRDNRTREAALPAHPSKVEDRMCLSLRAVALEAQKGPLSQEANRMAGIGWLEGYVLDPENQDVILIGRRAPQWPSLHLDDLAVNLRNVWEQGAQPYCSLDPRPEDVLKVNHLASQAGVMSSVDQMHEFFARLKEAWGPQTVVVGGVPKNSRHAHVMIDADYHMKKLSQGLARVDGVSSCLDVELAEAKKSIGADGQTPALGMSMSRFWFHVGTGEPTYEESEGIVCLDKCSVVVLTEKQRATADGSLVDSGGDDPHAQAFARQLSERFEQAARAVREYADLENVFRLSALVRAMHLQNATRKAGVDVRFVLKDFVCQMESPMLPSMPGLANSKEAQGTLDKGGMMYQYVLFPMVCGGVSMEMPANRTQFKKTDSARLDQLRVAVLKSRPSRNALAWPVPKS